MLPAKPPLDDEQTTRAEALRRASDVLAVGASDSSRRRVDAVDLVAVAGWIVDGRDPWPPREITAAIQEDGQ